MYNNLTCRILHKLLHKLPLRDGDNTGFRRHVIGKYQRRVSILVCISDIQETKRIARQLPYAFCVGTLPPPVVDTCNILHRRFARQGQGHLLRCTNDKLDILQHRSSEVEHCGLHHHEFDELGLRDTPLHSGSSEVGSGQTSSTMNPVRQGRR